jgi:hypothetical protein
MIERFGTLIQKMDEQVVDTKSLDNPGFFVPMDLYIDLLSTLGDATKNHATVLSESARANIQNMENRCYDVSQHYGQDSTEYVEMLRSLVRAMTNMLRIGGRITGEDELSLNGWSFITYGIIFHPKYHNGGKDRDELLGDWSFHS